MIIDNIDYNDKKTWDLYHQGKTKGIFQLESNLGKSWSKKAKPNNIEELAALISIIRPGTLKAMLDGKSLSQHYVDRKNGVDKITYLDPSLEDILKNTYGILCYQEQAMRIAQKLAGFSESEADVLRKAIGKKKADLMAKVKKDFIEGAEKAGIVDGDTASEIFGWIEKSARYSFNKCLSPNTIVITPNGEKLISELQIGDRVLAPQKKNVDNFVEVLDVIHNGEKELFEIEMEDGKTISCTLNHEFLCSDGEKHPVFEILEKDLEIMCID